MTEFQSFRKIPRLSRECIITEKLDGTNGQILIGLDGEFLVGSRNRWITPEDDNYGFAKWCHEHRQELLQLGPGRHFGEWWGQGIQRGYNQTEKFFSLFNVSLEHVPDCCLLVPVLHRGVFSTNSAEDCLAELVRTGSNAALGFMNPEGIIIYHVAGNCYFKKTIEKDEEPKSK